MEWLDWQPVRGSDVTLSDQLVAWVQQALHFRYRGGSRLPSVRRLAQSAGVSTHTVVAAYDKLMALGLVESRPGSGFFVRVRSPRRLRSESLHVEKNEPRKIDVNWMLNSFMGQSDSAGIPRQWLDNEMILAALRQVSRSAGSNLLGYGHSHGYRPLRQHIAGQLEDSGIQADPDTQLLLCSGVTQALDLLLRHWLRPGDAVVVEDPAWYLLFARLAVVDVRVLSVPRRADGPDLAVLEQLAREHRPRLVILNTVVHNPTGFSLSPAVAHGILTLAQTWDFHIIEDDTYSELHANPACRLAQLDQLNRVTLVGGYSKVMAAGLRVAYMAAAPELLQALVNLKMLAGLTSPELGERVIHRVLVDGPYRKHLERLRRHADADRHRTLEKLAHVGLAPDAPPQAGMFVWVNTGVDTESLVRALGRPGHLLVPGALFSPQQQPSTYMRINVSLGDDAQFWQDFARCLRSAKQSSSTVPSEVAL